MEVSPRRCGKAPVWLAGFAAVFCLYLAAQFVFLSHSPDVVRPWSDFSDGGVARVQGTLAYLGLDKRSVTMMSFERLDVHNAIIAKKPCPTGVRCLFPENVTTCAACAFGDSRSCARATVTLVHGQEDVEPMCQGSKAAWTSALAFMDGFTGADSAKHEAMGTNAAYRVVTLRCDFADEIQGGAELLVDMPGIAGYEAKRLRVDPLPSENTSHIMRRVEGRPVVCGRNVFNRASAELIAWHVEHNTQHGIGTTVLYEMGDSQISQRHLLDRYINDGSLLLVDLRDTLQDMHGLMAPVVTILSKAAGQTLTRHDCILRMRQMRPSWIFVWDVDEMLLPSAEGQMLSDWVLRNVSEVANAVIIDRHLPSSPCPGSGTIAELRQWFERSIARELASPKKDDFPKLGVRPQVPLEYWGIHETHMSVDLSKADTPEGLVNPAITQTAQPGAPILLHLRCANPIYT